MTSGSKRVLKTSYLSDQVAKDLSTNKGTTLDADASRLAALLVAYILPVCALLAPCHAGASTPIVATLFVDGPLWAAQSMTNTLPSSSDVTHTRSRTGSTETAFRLTTGAITCA